MKPYQHHDPVLDKGKAAPKPKRPTLYTYRGGKFSRPLISFDRKAVRDSRKSSIKTEKGRTSQSLSVIGTLCAILGIQIKGGRR